jgi:hypothetical protein
MTFRRRNEFSAPTKRSAYQRSGGICECYLLARRGIKGFSLDGCGRCLVRRVPNDGSQQWAAFVRALRILRPDVTTIVSYSDPSQGHTGALYRACNWWWAPTWHRLRPPPTGNGAWTEGKQESVKDRWIFPLAPDAARPIILRAQDDAILRRWPWAEYREPGGVSFKQFAALSAGKQTP